ncbi:hypothetical protein B0T20DRAFT_478183 [Sordaria brevicollis]|uniref:Uncharacterized protein n=1 Tax=Sordaria brevicollis TaxID=83679 RepID=A0AAE0PIU6_SORBR|nr:hypothetical protein B0T20DRAFT_478183 [Sordaria brevicollis]
MRTINKYKNVPGALFFKDLVPGNGLRWHYRGPNRTILKPRRGKNVCAALEVLVKELYPNEPNINLKAQPAKRTVHELLADVVDTATRFADVFPVLPNTWESRHLAAQGIATPSPPAPTPAVGEESSSSSSSGGASASAAASGAEVVEVDEHSFIYRAHKEAKLGKLLSREVFAGLFVAIVEAREKFLADERFAHHDRSRHCPLAQAVDRFKAAAWWWHKAYIPADIEIATGNDDE